MNSLMRQVLPTQNECAHTFRQSPHQTRRLENKLCVHGYMFITNSSHMSHMLHTYQYIFVHKHTIYCQRNEPINCDYNPYHMFPPSTPTEKQPIRSTPQIKARLCGRIIRRRRRRLPIVVAIAAAELSRNRSVRR